MNTYPSTLPCPQTDALTPAERRQLSDARRPREARALQRDRLTFERITFPPMPPEKTEILLAWWRTELVFGGAWFEATWPNLRGKIPLVRKFINQPRWEFAPGGFWRLSAVCEIRGLGSQPGTSDAFFQDVVLLCKMNRELGTTTIFDYTGFANHGQIEENSNIGSISSITAGSIIPAGAGGGVMSLEPYGVTPTVYQVAGVIPAAPQYGLSGPFTIELVHEGGDYRISGSGEFVLISCYNEATTSVVGYWRMWFSSGTSKLNFTVYDTFGVGPSTTVVSTINLPITAHVAVTRADDGLLRIFINGQHCGTSSSTAPFTLSTSRPIAIGGAPPPVGTNLAADGLYDEVRITAGCRYLTDFDYLAELPFPSH